MICSWEIQLMQRICNAVLQKVLEDRQGVDSIIDARRY